MPVGQFGRAATAPLSQLAESIIPTFPHRIIFTEHNEYYSSLMSECSCKLRTWARQYTGIHWAFQGVHGSQEPGCDKHGVNDTYWHSIIPRTGAIVTINVELAQARPNNCKIIIMHLNQIIIIHLQDKCGEMKEEGWTIDCDGKLQLIEFVKDRITLNLQDSVMDITKKWMMVPTMCPLVS